MTDEILTVDETAVDKILLVSKRTFKMKLLKLLEVDRGLHEYVQIDEWDIAHGTPDYPTPTGYFQLYRKIKNPDWHPPDSPWVGPELRDEEGKPKIVPGGDPANPIRVMFLDLGDGIGIHGTQNLDSIGTRASHGCIRVSEEDARELYRRIPLGTIVRIY